MSHCCISAAFQSFVAHFRGQDVARTLFDNVQKENGQTQDALEITYDTLKPCITPCVTSVSPDTPVSCTMVCLSQQREDRAGVHQGSVHSYFS